jgi:hypothetical protein
LAASTPADAYDEFGAFQHRNDFIKEQCIQLYDSITETAKELSLLYAANGSDDVKDF